MSEATAPEPIITRFFLFRMAPNCSVCLPVNEPFDEGLVGSEGALHESPEVESKGDVRHRCHVAHRGAKAGKFN